MQIKLHRMQPPARLLERLEKQRFKYSTPITLFHLVWLHGDNWCGVIGDGDNGAYEWFTAQGDKIETSDCGYGSTDVALRDVLMEVTT